MKPRLQKAILDEIFQPKYELFADIFEQSCLDFQRELVLNFRFRFYSADHASQERPYIFNPLKVDMPIIENAFDNARYVYFVISGVVHMMDNTGIYDYGIITKGSYFGDCSIILHKHNEFTYLYDPNYGDAKPLSLFKIKANTFMELLEKYPLEKEIWTERAKKREDFFRSYKALTLLKMMRNILKNPTIIRHNIK